ncbi:LysR family transcriptional regulator [Bacillus sp. Marseille-P3661]|uniref:LysR family transcriptional regulator n=1 Tax=Bacillus sp. Marseille-P3661 TaxID=1936234 RepID=UPI000C83C941|nr:LysR family transcriptional regulator [Bacillus sp. Marseille-P3661]
MEIHQLEYVIALSKYMKFSLAADEISVSQSTLSDQIKKLENELGVQLFIRSTRKVQLTSAGEDFLAYAKRIISEIENARSCMFEYSNLMKGKIKIGALSTITYLGITSVIANFQKDYPGFEMEIFEENSDTLLKKLSTSEIDVAFISYPYIANFEFDFYPLINDRLVLLVSSTHPLAERKEVSIEELSKEKFLMIQSSTGLQNSLVQLCRDAGFEPNIILKSSHVETIKGLIEEGIGITLFANRIAASISNEKTAIIELKEPVKRVTGLALSKNNRLLSTKTFKDYVLGRKI